MHLGTYGEYMKRSFEPLEAMLGNGDMLLAADF